jgi:hypothetical protein
MASRPSAPLPIQLQPISLSDDQLFYLAAMSLYSGRPHSHVHTHKLTEMDQAVADAELMWAVVRAHRRRPQPNDGDVPVTPNAHATTEP